MGSEASPRRRGEGGGHVTGRTVASGAHELPGTVVETAAEVDRRGGREWLSPSTRRRRSGRIVPDCVRDEQGLDILVNNACAPRT